MSPAGVVYCARARRVAWSSRHSSSDQVPTRAAPRSLKLVCEALRALLAPSNLLGNQKMCSPFSGGTRIAGLSATQERTRTAPDFSSQPLTHHHC